MSGSVFTMEFWKGLYDDVTEYVADFPIEVLKKVLDAMAGLIEGLDPPDFLSHSLGDVLGPSMPTIGYFMQQSGLAPALSLLASAIVFRLVRKIVTLGFW